MFISMSAIRQAGLKIGGVVSPKEGLVVGRDVVKDDDETEAGAGGGLLKLGRENTHKGQVARRGMFHTCSPRRTPMNFELISSNLIHYGIFFLYRDRLNLVHLDQSRSMVSF